MTSKMEEKVATKYIFLSDNSGSQYPNIAKIRSFLNLSIKKIHYIFDDILRKINEASEYGVEMSCTDFTCLNRLLEKIIKEYPDNHIRFVFTSDGAHNATDTSSYLASLKGCLNNIDSQILLRRSRNLRFDAVVVKSGHYFPKDFFDGFRIIVQTLLNGELKIMEIDEAKTLKHFQLFKGISEETKEDPISKLAGLLIAKDMVPDNSLINSQIDELIKELKDKSIVDMKALVDFVMDGDSTVSLKDFVLSLSEIFRSEEKCNMIRTSTVFLQQALQLLAGRRPSEQRAINYYDLVVELKKLHTDLENFNMEIEFTTDEAVELLTEIATDGIIALGVYVTKVTFILNGKTDICSLLDYLKLSKEEKKKYLAVLPHKFMELPMWKVLCKLYDVAPTRDNYQKLISQILLLLFTMKETDKISSHLLQQQLHLVDYIVVQEPPFTEDELQRFLFQIESDKDVPPGGEQSFEFGNPSAMTLLVYLLLRMGIDPNAISRMYLKFMNNYKLAGPHAVHSTKISIEGLLDLLEKLEDGAGWGAQITHMQTFLGNLQRKNSPPGGFIEEIPIEVAFFALTQTYNVHDFAKFLMKVVKQALKDRVGRGPLSAIFETVGPKVVRAVLIHSGIVDEDTATLYSKEFVGGTVDLAEVLCGEKYRMEAIFSNFFVNPEELPLTRAFEELREHINQAKHLMEMSHRYKQEMKPEMLLNFFQKEEPIENKCVTCDLSLKDLQCMPHAGRISHNHDKYAIPGIMNFFRYMAMFFPDKDILSFLVFLEPWYKEIVPFLKRFSDIDEKEEFRSAALYYIGHFKHFHSIGYTAELKYPISTSVRDLNGFFCRDVLRNLMEHFPNDLVKIILMFY